MRVVALLMPSGGPQPLPKNGALRRVANPEILRPSSSYARGVSRGPGPSDFGFQLFLARLHPRRIMALGDLDRTVSKQLGDDFDDTPFLSSETANVYTGRPVFCW
jgi:hypothetical protein